MNFFVCLPSSKFEMSLSPSVRAAIADGPRTTGDESKDHRGNEFLGSGARRGGERVRGTFVFRF